MESSKLLRLVEEHEKLEQQLEVSGRLVWDAFAEVEPSLAREILSLFSTSDAAAKWVASPFREFGHSPAREACEGRTTDLMSRVLQTMHGFYG